MSSSGNDGKPATFVRGLQPSPTDHGRIGELDWTGVANFPRKLCFVRTFEEIDLVASTLHLDQNSFTIDDGFLYLTEMPTAPHNGSTGSVASDLIVAIRKSSVGEKFTQVSILGATAIDG